MWDGTLMLDPDRLRMAGKGFRSGAVRVLVTHESGVWRIEGVRNTKELVGMRESRWIKQARRAGEPGVSVGILEGPDADRGMRFPPDGGSVP